MGGEEYLWIRDEILYARSEEDREITICSRVDDIKHRLWRSRVFGGHASGRISNAEPPFRQRFSFVAAPFAYSKTLSFDLLFSA